MCTRFRTRRFLGFEHTDRFEASTKTEDYSYQHEHHDSRTSTPSATSDSQKNPGMCRISLESAELPGIAGDVTIGLVPPRVNPGETRKLYWERLRKFARVAEYRRVKDQEQPTLGLPKQPTRYMTVSSRATGAKGCRGSGGSGGSGGRGNDRSRAGSRLSPLATGFGDRRTGNLSPLATNPSEETQEKIGSAQQPENQNGGVSGSEKFQRHGLSCRQTLHCRWKSLG